MRPNTRYSAAFVFLFSILAATACACSSPPRTSDLGSLQNELAQHEGPYRNPIILIPGIPGSKIEIIANDVKKIHAKID